MKLVETNKLTSLCHPRARNDSNQAPRGYHMVQSISLGEGDGRASRLYLGSEKVFFVFKN